MGTRAVITFKDDRNEFHVYQHNDGDPVGMLDNLMRAKGTAWPLPRFDADQFAACYVHAGIQSYIENFNRMGRPFEPGLGNGGMRLTKGRGDHFDLEWAYVVQIAKRTLWIDVFLMKGPKATMDWTGDLDAFSGYVLGLKEDPIQ